MINDNYTRAQQAHGRIKDGYDERFMSAMEEIQELQQARKDLPENKRLCGSLGKPPTSDQIFDRASEVFYDPAYCWLFPVFVSFGMVARLNEIMDRP